MRFTPGPGLGGHCIPIDPFYLSWRARQFDFQTEFIELAGKVNQTHALLLRRELARALNRPRSRSTAAAVLVLGVAYKPDVDDTRESPALKLIELLARGSAPTSATTTRSCPSLLEYGLDLRSVELADGVVEAADCVVVVTAHSGIDYADLAGRAQLVVDFRNAVPRDGGKVHVL